MRQIVTRRTLLEGSLVAAVSVAAGSGRAESELSEAEKIAHADAKYQPTPNGQQRCEICLQFRAARSLQNRPQSRFCQRVVPVFRGAGERTLNDVPKVSR